MVHSWKELFVQLFKTVYEQSLNRSPWPRCDNGKKKSSSIFGSVCQSCDEIPDWKRERGDTHTMLGFGLTGQSLSELPGGTQSGRFHDTKVKRSAGKCIKFIFLFRLLGEPDGPIFSVQTLKSPVRTWSVMSFSGLRRIGHWELFEAFSCAIKEFQLDEL